MELAEKSRENRAKVADNACKERRLKATRSEGSEEERREAKRSDEKRREATRSEEKRETGKTPSKLIGW